MPVIRDSSNKKKNGRSGLVLNCFGSFLSKLLCATLCHKLKSHFVLGTFYERKSVAMPRTQTNQTGHIFTPQKNPAASDWSGT